MLLQLAHTWGAKVGAVATSVRVTFFVVDVVVVVVVVVAAGSLFLLCC